jgi:two-component system sensor histidine kinase BaeS
MLLSLRSRLSLSYILVALIGVALIGALANFLLEQQFRKYIRENQERVNLRTVAAISRQYSVIGQWGNMAIDQIGMSALEQGLILRIQDNTNRVIWDAMLHNNGMCRQMIVHMARNMQSRYPNFKGGYTERSYNLMHNFKKVGSVRIGYYGPFFFTDNDLAFINTLNRLLFGVAVLALIMALIVGAVTAKRISSPIAQVIGAAQLIADGDYEVKSHPPSNIREINQLNAAIIELAATLKKQEMLRKQLTADVAHELRTPLATLQSYLEAMIDGIWDPDRQRLKGCHEEIMRISRMVQDLEKLSKFESGQLVLNQSEFDLMELIRQLMLGFETEARSKEIRLTFGDTPVLIRADRDKISQVLINLVANSLKFTPVGGEVGLAVDEQADQVKITVKDNGCGIAAEDLPYIFERFYRADKARVRALRNRITGGSGIGLTITKAIVEAHGGTIGVSSKLGGGAEFVVSLPKNV